MSSHRPPSSRRLVTPVSCAFAVLCLAFATLVIEAASPVAQRGAPAGSGAPQERERPRYSLSDPVPNDPALKGAIDLHAHQDPDSNGPSYGQAARSVDALDLYTRAKAAGMRGFVIKEHLDQSAGLAYYMRKIHPDMEIFGGVGSNFTSGPKVNPWNIIHMTEMKGGWGRVVWMPSWDSENSSHRVNNYAQHAQRLSKYYPVPFVSVAQCQGGGLFWASYPKPCEHGELLPEVKEAIRVIATTKTRDSNGDLVLATGHNSPEEIMLMLKEAVAAGVKHTIITHPLLDVVEMTDATLVDAHLSRNAGNAIAAQLLARSAVLGGEAILMQDKNDAEHGNQTCVNGGLWSLPFPPYPIGAGTVELTITDEQSKLNLNDVADPKTEDALKEIFRTLKLDPSLVDRVKAWIAPVTQAVAGQDASNYCLLPMACEPKHAPLTSLDDLRVIQGFDDASIRALRRFVTAYRLDTPPRSKPPLFPVNVNTADPLVLTALGCQGSDAFRASGACFKAVADVESCRQVPAGNLTVKSTAFSIKGTGMVGDTTQSVTAVVRPTAKSTKRLSWRERPVSDLSPAEIR